MYYFLFNYLSVLSISISFLISAIVGVYSILEWNSGSSNINQGSSVGNGGKLISYKLNIFFNSKPGGIDRLNKYLKRYEVLSSCLRVFFGFYNVVDLFRLCLLHLNTTNLSLKEKECSTLHYFGENIPQFIIPSYHITASQSENFSVIVVISLCFSVVSIILSVIVRTNESLSRMKMVTSFKYTETMWSKDTIKLEHEIGNNRTKKIDKKTKKIRQTKKQKKMQQVQVGQVEQLMQLQLL